MPRCVLLHGCNWRMSGENKAVEALVLAKAERKALRRHKRDQRLARFLDKTEMSSLEDVDLKRHAGLSEEKLIEIGLDEQQRWKVRQWELPKKAIAYALEASNQHVTAMIRAKTEKSSTTINVENMNVVQLPEKREETVAPVIIEVTPETSK